MMKAKFVVGFLSVCLLNSVHAQSVVIDIVGGPTGTLITDCETGQPVGAGFLSAVYWAPSPTTDRNSFVQLGATMSVVNGRMAGGSRTITTPGAVGAINLYGAAWESAFGNSYEIASQVPGAKVGWSEIIRVPLPATTPIRIPDFQVCPVPEPSAIGLGALALIFAGLLRYRKC